MKLRLLHLALLAALPLTGFAQSLPRLAPDTANYATSGTPLVDALLDRSTGADQAATDQNRPLLPIWSGANGHLLAVIALPRDDNSPIDAMPAYGGPSAWQLAGSSSNAAGGLSWQLGSGVHADALFGQYLDAAPACTFVNCDASANNWSRHSQTATLGLGWQSPTSALDLSYGLSWLKSSTPPALSNGLKLDNGFIPVLRLPDVQPFSLTSENAVYARGRWQFQPDRGIDLTASYGRGRAQSTSDGGLSTLNASGVPNIDLDQLSLSLGLDAGSLRGAIIGHVTRSDDPIFAGKNWTTLDLGVSWRTPWSGELSVGAQNLLNAPINTSRDADAAQTRTPYIEYRQDL